MHVVVFPGWYPGRLDKLSGDFIQRHLHAIALNCQVTVIIPVKDPTVKRIEEVKIVGKQITEIYYYYPSLTSVKWLDNFLSFIRYNYISISKTQSLLKNGKISLVHLYVLQKNQILGLLLKWLYGLPYVISEQSTLYVDGRWEKLHRLHKKVVRYVFQRASSFHAVSKFLQSSINNKLYLKKDGVVIPNVVDEKQFYFKTREINDRVTFVHVSNMTFQKNVEGMLKAFALVKKVTSNFSFNLVGPIKSSILGLIEELALTENVIVWNERDYKEVAQILQQSDVFIFFTRFETFGCVIIEANACGLPVIISDLDVTRELITDKVNGLFIESENEKNLVDKILYFIDHQQEFDPLTISLKAIDEFNYETVSRKFLNWYTKTLSN